MTNRVRLRDTDLYGEWVDPDPLRVSVTRITTADGEELGLIEYVCIPAYGSSSYGWRPVGSTWNGRQLSTKTEAAHALLRKGQP